MRAALTALAAASALTGGSAEARGVRPAGCVADSVTLAWPGGSMRMPNAFWSFDRPRSVGIAARPDTIVDALVAHGDAFRLCATGPSPSVDLRPSPVLRWNLPVDDGDAGGVMVATVETVAAVGGDHPSSPAVSVPVVACVSWGGEGVHRCTAQIDASGGGGRATRVLLDAEYPATTGARVEGLFRGAVDAVAASIVVDPR